MSSSFLKRCVCGVLSCVMMLAITGCVVHAEDADAICGAGAVSNAIEVEKARSNNLVVELAIDTAAESTVEPVVESETPVVDDDAERMELEWVKNHLDKYYTDEEIRQTAAVVQAEDLMAYSQTIWSAHVWTVLNRVGRPGFAQNDSIIGILSAKNQFSTYKPKYLEKEINEDVLWIVKDVFARKILEKMGASEEMVGRTLPADYCFFKASGGKYNNFYKYCWREIYNPFKSPYNPYDN